MAYVEYIDMMNLTKKKQIDIQPSSRRTTREQEIAKFLSETVNKDKEMLREINLLKVNFDVVETKKNYVYIRCIYLVQGNGETIPVPYNRLISPPRKNKLVEILRKVGAAMWPRICIDSKVERMVSRIYYSVIVFFGILVLISGTSLLGADFIPKPIDRAIFWPSLAGGLGFYIDYVKRGLSNDRQ